MICESQPNPFQSIFPWSRGTTWVHLGKLTGVGWVTETRLADCNRDFLWVHVLPGRFQCSNVGHPDTALGLRSGGAGVGGCLPQQWGVYLKHTRVKSAPVNTFRVSEGKAGWWGRGCFSLLLSQGGVAPLRHWQSATGKCNSKYRTCRDTKLRAGSPWWQERSSQVKASSPDPAVIIPVFATEDYSVQLFQWAQILLDLLQADQRFHTTPWPGR